jgi:hypothetical protein
VRLLRVCLSLLACVALEAGCAHPGAGSEPDQEAAVAAGVRAALLLYTPPSQTLQGPFCVEVAASADFERGVVAALGGLGILAVAMPDCAVSGRDAVLWVKIQSYESMDWVAHGTLDVRGTVETPPDERSNFRLAWWRASFHASLGFRGGQWVTLSASDLGHI